MYITLTWAGPYGFGQFKELEQYPYADDPHVYVRVQTFHSRKIAGVGKTANLSNRMSEHLRGFLSRQYCLSDDNQTYKYRPEGLAGFDTIDDWLGTAVAEVKRFSFFAAPCGTEQLRYVEAELIDRLWNTAEKSRGCIERDNQRKRK